MTRAALFDPLGLFVRHEPLPSPEVDIPRFMGTWYVLGGILTPIERFAHNPVERYTLEPDGSIDTHFQFRLGSPFGRFCALRSRAHVAEDPSGSVWEMEFVPPIRLDYRIAYIDVQYEVTLVARARRDLLWIMARTPDVDTVVYGELVARAEGLGYDPDRIRTAPHYWPHA